MTCAAATLSSATPSAGRNHGETSELVQAKAEAARAHGMTPILCIGETQQQRDAGQAMDVLARQLEGSLPAAGDGDLVVAYEPVWAIGTGRTATAEDVREAHAHVRAQLQKAYGETRSARRCDPLRRVGQTGERGRI